MKITFDMADEGIAKSGKITADVYLTGNRNCEVKFTEVPEKISPFAVHWFLRGVKSKVRKEADNICIVTQAGSNVCEACEKSNKLKYENSEYMYVIKKDKSRKKEEDAELKFTNGAESEEDTIIATSVSEAGFSAKLRPLGDMLYIYDVAVKKDLRNRGMGTKYMKSLLYGFKDSDLCLQVGSSNPVAVHLYEKLGFTISEELRYYSV